ncbi:MAG: carboxylesterase family protein [Acidobacteriaceae bacterium]
MVADATQRPVVRIDSGALRGVRVDALQHGGAFLGIPFAAQPVGALRWKAPQKPPHWQGIRDAAAWGPACPQRPSPWLPEMLGIPKMATDEACLWLNVWTPELHPREKLPVFVWVHGGGNVEGSGEWPPLGVTLAQQGIVVVSFNYRLGALGFFASRELDAESPQHVSGNYGHLDQLAALAWVKRNIAAFGGDPAKVTIGGESSGALDVCNLMASPLAAGLLRGAILESGVCVDSVYPRLREAEENGKLLAKDLGADSLEKLRAAPAERVLEAAAQDDNLDLEPVVDGWVLPQQPAITFAKGKQIAVPTLVGSNEDEISIFASPIVGGKSYRPKTVVAYRAWLQRRFGPLADHVFQEYPVQADSDAAHTFRTMDTDCDFAFGAWLMARQMQQAGASAFLYRFNYVGAGPFAELGAFHSEELMFLSKRYWTSWVAQPGDADLSRAIIGYWTQFVKTGNPNGADLPVWAPVNADAKTAQELGRRIGPEAVPRLRRFPVFQTYLTNRLQKTE